MQSNRMHCFQAKLENAFVLDYSVTSLEGAIVGNVEVLDPDFVDVSTVALVCMVPSFIVDGVLTMFC